MNIINRARRTAVVTALVASVAVALGAAGSADAGTDESGDPAPTSVPADAAGADNQADPGMSSVPASLPAESPADSDVANAADVRGSGAAAIPSEHGRGAAPPGRGAPERPRPPDAVPTTVSAVAPAAPGSLTATVGNSTVQLTWLAPADDGGSPVDQYAVQRATSASGPWSNLAYPTTTSYLATGQLNGVTWYYRIKAHNAAGWSPASNVVSAVPFSVPGEPNLLQATPVDSGAKLTWLAPSYSGGRPIDEYRVQRSTSPNGAWSDRGTTAALAFSESGLYNGVTYYYRVAAHNAAGWGPYTWPTKVVPRTVPLAPYAPVVTPLSSTSIRLNWTSPVNGGAPIDTYQVEQATSPNGPFDIIGHPKFTVHDATGLKPGTTYYFRILAHNAAGWGPDSGVFSHTMPKTVPSAPFNCSAVQVSGLGYANVLFDWNTPVSDGGSAIAGYEIYVFRMGSGEYVKSIYTTGASSYRYDSLPNGYFDIYVQARNSVGLSQKCTTWMMVKL